MATNSDGGTPPLDADKDDDPRESSAALCISLQVAKDGRRFGPEYSHQCFDGEHIRGYHPVESSLTGHKSYANHALATHELKIQVVLAPSCQMCWVDLSIRRKLASPPRPKRSNKRQCVASIPYTESTTTDDEDDETDAAAGDDEEGDDSFHGDEEEEESVTMDDSVGKTRHRRMPPEEILERLGKALPAQIQDRVLVEGDSLRQPLGRIIETFSIEDKEYTLTLANGCDVHEYHSQVQKLALFYIESADGVDLNQTQGGYWKVLYLFQKIGTRQHALCGYMTLFHFHSPFRKPVPGTIVRICQALLLPPYQRQGHGKRMLRAVHDISKQQPATEDSTPPIVEINVEDPAPAFTALRNRVDFELLVESLSSDEPWLSAPYTSPKEFPTLKSDQVSHIARQGRITIHQAHIAYELYKLSTLASDNVDDEKQYRLMVKKRLLKLHHEELSTCCKTKEERQVRLADIWRNVFAKYQQILKLAR